MQKKVYKNHANIQGKKLSVSNVQKKKNYVSKSEKITKKKIVMISNIKMTDSFFVRLSRNQFVTVCCTFASPSYPFSSSSSFTSPNTQGYKEEGRRGGGGDEREREGCIGEPLCI